MPCPLYCHYKYWGDGIGGGWLIYIWGVGGGTGGGYHLIVFFSCAFVFVSSRSESLYLGDKSMMAVVSVSLFFLCFLCLWFLLLGVTSAWKLLCLLRKIILKVRSLIIILWISLKKGRVFWFQSLFSVCLPYSIHQ